MHSLACVFGGVFSRRNFTLCPGQNPNQKVPESASWRRSGIGIRRDREIPDYFRSATHIAFAGFPVSQQYALHLTFESLPHAWYICDS